MQARYLKVKELIKVKIFKSEEHTNRLFKSANTLGMDMPFTEKQINEAKDELIQ